ncbi:unnamed protein product, partial [Prunus brigantina]
IHVPWTVELEGFIPRWKQQFHEDYRNITAAELDYFGLWAYDAVLGLAMAVEKIGFSSNVLGLVIWPGDSLSVPKGWEVPTDGKKLRIGVPVKVGFTEFVKVTKNPRTNTTDVTGFSIDVFKAAVELLPFALPFDFIPFAKPDGTSAGSYDDLCYQVYLGVKFLTISISFIQGGFASKARNFAEMITSFDDSKIKGFRTMWEIDEALSKGSGKGGVAAVV